MEEADVAGGGGSGGGGFFAAAAGDGVFWEHGSRRGEESVFAGVWLFIARLFC